MVALHLSADTGAVRHVALAHLPEGIAVSVTVDDRATSSESLDELRRRLHARGVARFTVQSGP